MSLLTSTSEQLIHEVLLCE